MKIRLGIVGYGNLGRGMVYAAAQNEDMELRYIFTRRDPIKVKSEIDGEKASFAGGSESPGVEDVIVLGMDEAKGLTGEIDVMVLCGGSATDLPEQTPKLAKLFNVVDSYDTHAKIPEHFEKVDQAAKAGGKTAIISAGWDPGLFSLIKLVSEAILPFGGTYAFWGDGVSQGHSDAIRRVDGVLDARQYTLPIQSALDAVRAGGNPELGTRQKHTRDCFVVAEEGADLKRVENDIVSMPYYFADYDTTVHFISAEELARDHSSMPHGGFVLRSGKTGAGDANNQIIEYRLKLDSNPEFTSSVLAACARAAYRMNKEGMPGCKTILDVPPSYYLPESAAALRKKYL